ncbi:hypothetical protein Acsp03_60220 [Actinomadura sp. NBRC 104412]|nr:hypothetical protein Acsp03_60220 [Actinomadura sp. NBRC 104412]
MSDPWGIIRGMSRDTHSGLQCPHCRTHLTLVAAPGQDSTSPLLPPPPVPAREEWTPPPVGEVLAEYAHRSIDTATARRGAARVRDSFNKARQAAAQKRNEQRAARRGGASGDHSPPDAAPPGRATSGRSSPRRAAPGKAAGDSGGAFGSAVIRSA